MCGDKSCLGAILSNAAQQGISDIINIKNQLESYPLDVAQESIKEFIQDQGGIHSSRYENEMRKTFFSACDELLYDTSDDED